MVAGDRRTNTIGPSKLMTARPISAPYSSCQRAHRLRRTVEARQVREHHERAVPAGRIDRPGILRTTAGTASRRSTVGPVGRARSRARQRPRLHARACRPGCRRCARPRPPPSRRRATRPIAPAARSLVDDRAHDRADVEGLLPLRVVLGGEDVADGREVAARGGVCGDCGRRGRSDRRCAAPREPFARHDVGVLVVRISTSAGLVAGRAPSTAPVRSGP